MTIRKNTQSVMMRQDKSALEMNANGMEAHLAERRQQIKDLADKNDNYARAIDAINTIAGRASAGHGSECECSYCLIHRLTIKAWHN